MNELRSFCFLLVIASTIIGLQGCGSTKVERSKDLVVVHHTDTVRGVQEWNSYEWAAFTVDVPVDGPKALVDSVIAFVNRELYHACEIGSHFEDSVVTFKKSEVYSHDGEQLFSRFMEKYRPILQDSLWSSYGLELKMEAQTDKYVTYGLEFFHCGISCGSEKYYYTFDKHDGHQVEEIISKENLSRFFKDYPEYASENDYLWKYSPENDFDNSCYGLLDDHFSLVIMGWYNHYFSVDVPYSQIFSYLSSEAQELVGQKSDGKLILPPYLPKRSEDRQVWMEVDTVNNAILGYVRAAGGPLVDTLKHYDPELEVHLKRVHSIDGAEGSSVFILIYSFGHLLYLDEAMICTIDENGLKPTNLFAIEGKRDSIVSCMWYDQLVEASNGFPYEKVDENRFGIHYDWFTKRLYVPIMDSHGSGSEFANTSCLQYTGRYNVLQFNGKEFIPVGTDGAWWLNSDLRNYRRTVSNKKCPDGIEQIDLMPDGTYRRTFWKGAKTLDDLRKKPDDVRVGKNIDKL